MQNCPELGTKNDMSSGAKSEPGKTLDYSRRDPHYPYAHLGDPYTNPTPYPHAHLGAPHHTNPPHHAYPHHGAPHHTNPPHHAYGHLGDPHHTNPPPHPHAHLGDPRHTNPYPHPPHAHLGSPYHSNPPPHLHAHLGDPHTSHPHPHHPHVHLGDPHHTNSPLHPHAHLGDPHTSHPHPHHPHVHLGDPHHTNPPPHPHAHLGDPHTSHHPHHPHTQPEDPPPPPPSCLEDLPMGLNPQMMLAPNEAGEGWATSQLSEQHWAVPCQDDQNTMLSPHWQQKNPSSTETLICDDANALQHMGTVDPSSWSGAQSVSEILPDLSSMTLGLWPTFVSGAEPGGSLEEGVGHVRNVGEFEGSHFFGAPGEGQEGTNFESYESQEVSEIQQRLEDWWPSDPMRRDSLLDDQVLTEAVFSRKETSSGTECEENLRQRSDPSSSQPAERESIMNPCSKYEESFVNEFSHLRPEEDHEEETPYTCLRCGESFFDSYHLMVHLDGHWGDNPFRCLECDETFFWDSQLMAHSTRHSQKKPFQCLECGLVFCWAKSLWAHIKSHHRKKPQTSMLDQVS